MLRASFRAWKVAVALLIIICMLQLQSQDRNNLQFTIPASKQEPCDPKSHSVCFIGKRFCYPGYTGDVCDQKLVPANPWYSEGCPNLEQENTFDIDMPLEMFYTKDNCSHAALKMGGITGCANLCFSHPVSGVPQIPLSFWREVQANEATLWKGYGASDDRIQEHLEGFDNYKSLPSDLGNYIEIGCGPFTQTQGIIKRNFKQISLLDPGIDAYLTDVQNCTYKQRTLMGKHVRLLSYGAEKLAMNDDNFGKYDTLMSINVIDHVWDAYQFLSNIYNALKPGGILIFHDRFSPTPIYLNSALGPGHWYHPIRVSKKIFNHFFDQFEEIYLFEGLTRGMIERKCGEVGFYFIGRKK